MGKRSGIWEWFLDLCSTNQMAIGGSSFSHKHTQKFTWRSLIILLRISYLVDHMCISVKFRRLCLYVRVIWGVSVPFDHHLLVMTLRLLLKKYPSNTQRCTRYTVGLLKNRDIHSMFQLRYHILVLQDTFEDGDTNVEDQSNLTKQVWKDTCEEVFGKTGRQHIEWISVNTLEQEAQGPHRSPESYWLIFRI
jgi:hypothetical protein